jgi:uncharacterized protein (TIGR03000 family)
MFRNIFWSGVLLVLAGTMVLALPGSVRAQHHGGGGHFGGGHAAAFHAGSFHSGAFHPGIAHVGSFHHMNGFNHVHPNTFVHFHSNAFFRRGFPFVNGSFFPFVGGYPLYGGYYGDYPDYGPMFSSGYPSSPAYPYPDVPYSAGPTVLPNLSYGAISRGALPELRYPGANADLRPTSPDTNLPAPTPLETRSHFTVTVPADARLWFAGSLTTSTGRTREFDTPPVVSGKKYVYDVRAIWMEGGKEVTQTQRVEFEGGARVEVTFPKNGN